MFQMRTCVALLAVAWLAGTCLAEDAAPTKFYKLEFVVKETDGAKVLNARTYSVMVSGVVVSGEREIATGSCSIRTGNRVPYSTGKENTYLDVGVNIDCRSVREAPSGLNLRVDTDISSVAQESNPPVVRQNKWDSNVTVPLRKPVVVFSSDDLTSRHQMQLEITATPIT
jgi:hypothetical protein